MSRIKGKREAMPVIVIADKWTTIFESKTECARFFGLRVNTLNKLINERQNLPCSKHPDKDPYEDIWFDNLTLTKEETAALRSKHVSQGKKQQGTVQSIRTDSSK